jgi:FkbM family methyltransferase
MASFLSRARNHLIEILLPFVLLPRRTVELVRLGSEYGGWWVPIALVRDGAVVYLAGAGEDITLDLALYDRGCYVRTMDPTPRAIEHARAHAPDNGRFRFLPLGLWHEDTTLRFYAPADARHVSHSVVNLQRTSDYFEARVTTLRSAMTMIGDRGVDLLKLDIEGAEHSVIRDVLRHGPLPTAICLEFDQPCSIASMRSTVRALRNAGYSFEKLELWNCTFVRAAELTSRGRRVDAD